MLRKRMRSSSVNGDGKLTLHATASVLAVPAPCLWIGRSCFKVGTCHSGRTAAS